MTAFSTETLHLGGGNLVEMLRMDGGEVVTYNDECLCIYKSEQDFWANMDGQDVAFKIFWIKEGEQA